MEPTARFRGIAVASALWTAACATGESVDPHHARSTSTASESGGGGDGPGGAASSTSTSSTASSGGAGGAGGAVAPVALATDQSFPWGVVLDGGFAYWTARGESDADGRVARVSLDGGPIEVVAAMQGSPDQLAVRDASVYWSCYAADGAIMRADTSGTSSSPLVAAQTLPIGVAADATHVYWTTSDGFVRRAPRAGGEAVVDLASGVVSASLLALDDAFVYVSTFADPGQLVRIAKTGGEPEVLVADLAFGSGLAVADGTVFFAEYGRGTVSRIDAAGGEPTVLASDQGGPAGVALDDAYVYWAGFDDGSVARVARQGGGVSVLAVGQGAPNGIAVDAQHVVFTDHRAAGRLVSVAKP